MVNVVASSCWKSWHQHDMLLASPPLSPSPLAVVRSKALRQPRFMPLWYVVAQ